jgi:hypothetical protein
MAYFAAVAAFSISAATSCARERVIAWLPGSSMTCDWARVAMNRSRSGLRGGSAFGTEMIVHTFHRETPKDTPDRTIHRTRAQRTPGPQIKYWLGRVE